MARVEAQRAARAFVFAAIATCVVLIVLGSKNMPRKAFASERLPLVLQAPGASMLWIPGGTFTMGSTPNDVLRAVSDCGREPYAPRCSGSFFEDEVPQHQVLLPGFWLDRLEVSVAQFEACVVRGACSSRPVSEALRRRERALEPVSHVSWYDARDYCAARGARLPSEAEFERAARGRFGRRYPWGEMFNRRVANCGRFGWSSTDNTDGHQRLSPVGSFPSGATPEGVLDLAGNVEEWVSDRFRAYSKKSDLAAPPQALRVVRGGSYETARSWVRGSARNYAPPAEREASRGFRCARSSTGPRAEARSD